MHAIIFFSLTGWLCGFKKRHGIGMHVLSGESAGIDRTLISTGQERALEAIQSYAMRDVFNMDETGLFYRMTPDRSLTTANSTKGVKKAKDRITVALCTNMDGSEKLKPLVIGKSKNPRCFKSFNASLYVDYLNNRHAWMTSALFADWIAGLDRKMRRQRRHVLLLMDNAPSHIIPELTNVKVHFLPPTTTSHLQPLDAGIIAAFKARYRRQQLQWIVEAIDTKKSTTLYLDDAIRFIHRAWNGVTQTTIFNCWRHVGLVPSSTAPTNPCDEDEDDLPLAELIRRSAAALDIPSDQVMDPKELSKADDAAETFPSLDDETITDIVQNLNGQQAEGEDDNEDTADDDVPPPPPTRLQLCNAIDVLRRGIESHGWMNIEHVGKLDSIASDFLKGFNANSVQKSIADYFVQQK